MRTNIEQRACDLAVYIIENKATVRAAAAQFGVSKSTVHIARTTWSGLYGGLNESKTQYIVFITARAGAAAPALGFMPSHREYTTPAAALDRNSHQDIVF